MIRALVEQHASEAAFLWSRRALAVAEPHYDLGDIERLDERVEAHLDALRLAGDGAWEICAAALDEAEPGTAFTAAVMAVELGDLERIARILDVLGEAPEVMRGIVSALGWVSFEHVRRILPGLLDLGCPPALHRLGIAACAAHRQDPGPALGYAIFSDDLRLRARALRAVGEIPRHDLYPELRRLLPQGDDGCRFAAAFSLGLSRDAEAVEVLWSFARGGSARGERAAALAARCADPEAANERVRVLGAQGHLRAAIAGAGALGDPAIVPWLVELMAAPEHARVAGEAFTLISGADLAREPLRGEAPEGLAARPNDDDDDDDVSMDPDENLPWPSAAAASAWFAKRRGELPRGVRHVLGKPVTTAWLEQVIRDGYQRQRAAAAIELAVASPGRPLFEVRAPGRRQRQVQG